jgi:acyl-CoA thioesterase
VTPSSPLTAGSLHPFDADTAVVAAGEGRWTAVLTDRWDTPNGPNGGYSLATAVRAIGEALPHPDPFAVSATYLRPVRHGDADLAVEVVRSGRRLSVGEARLVQDGTERLRVTATFADLAAQQGPDRELAGPPDVPDPDACPPPGGGGAPPPESSAFTIGQRYEYRTPQPLGFTRGAPSGRSEFDLWMRFAEPRDPDPLGLTAFVDGAPPAVMELGELASTTVQLTIHVRRRPAPGWCLLHISTRHIAGGYHEEDVDVWDSTGRLVAQSRQLALLPLYG